MTDLISSNLADKNKIRSDLTDPDPDGYPLFVATALNIKTKVSQIIGKKKYLNDTCIVSDFSHPNSIIYDADESMIIDDMETFGNWSSVGTPVITIAADATAGHFWVGANGTKATWADSSGTAIIRSTQSYGDLSGATSEASGTPSTGTAGIWVYTPVGTVLSGIKLKLGSSSTAWKKYNADLYSDIASFENTTLTLLQFNLDSPDATAGTVDWTAIDYVEIEWTIAAAGNVTFTYLTISKSNDISCCGLGDRRTTSIQFTVTTGL